LTSELPALLALTPGPQGEAASRGLAELLRDLSGWPGGDLARAGVLPLMVVLATAGAAAFFVSWLYAVFYGSRATGSEIQRAFPLLGISVAAIFVAIQFSLPLSLGLLGALSIVRFRTPIKEPEEIGFLMVVIASSLACATYHFAFLALLLATVVAALLLQRAAPPLFGRRSDRGLIYVSLGAGAYRDHGERLLERLRELARGEVEAVTEHDERVTVAYRFRGLRAERAVEVSRRLAEAATGAETQVLFDGGAP
jgi:hypothetical protein